VTAAFPEEGVGGDRKGKWWWRRRKEGGGDGG